jgi:magnesium-transporting ATPase (P-type)
VQKKISVSPENMLLRGSSLRNTEWIIGFVVYSGHQTKIMMNSANSRFKMSSIEKGTNKQIIFIFIAQILMCIICSIILTIMQKQAVDTAWYIYPKGIPNDKELDRSIGFLLFRGIGVWVLCFV